jgi:serine protease DegQ
VSINGARLRDSGSLRNAIGLLPPGEEVTVGLIRGGREQTVKAVLGELEQTATATAVPEQEEAPALDAVFEGAEIVENSAGSVPGLLVVRVDPGSPAAERGLRPNDIITKVNRVRVRSMPEALAVMQDARAIILEIQRGTRSQLILMR